MTSARRSLLQFHWVESDLPIGEVQLIQPYGILLLGVVAVLLIIDSDPVPAA